MKKFAYVIAGATVSAVVGFFASAGLSYIYEMKLAKSQDNMDSFAVFLIMVLIPVFTIAGGFVGKILYRRSLTNIDR
jgi:undecaprenyl pyrophosphate phosphatase UppP